MANLAHWDEGGRPYGSSIAYANYPSRINDGIKDFSGNTNNDTAWSSASEKLPQWAAVVFRRPASVNRIAVYWGRVGDWATSRRFRVECWTQKGWKRVAALQRSEPERMTEAAFDPVTCEAVRLHQGVGNGPEATPDRMCVAELEAHGAFIHGPEVDHLRIRDALREEWEGNYREMRRPITREVLARIDRKARPKSLTGPIGRAEMEKARRNITSTQWAKSLSEKIIADANWWMEKDDGFIYDMIPPENPRAISPSYERGCPIHGGGRRCMRTNTALPYRWQCAEGGEWWYNGAKVRNPATGQLVEVRDDGDGWTSPPGFANPGTTYHFQSAWRYYVLSKLFFHPYEQTIPSDDAYTGGTAITQLAHAYAITGDERYAHKAGVMLNRLAEVYRFYNGTVDEQRPLTRGYLVQVSWEEWPIHDCLAAYDLIAEVMLRDRTLLDFFRSKGDCDYNGDGKVNFEDLRHNIHHNLFGYMCEWLHRAMSIQTGDYIVREGLVLAAVGAMLDNRELVEEAIDGPFGLATNLTNNTFRDGKWWYDSPGYSVGCITGMSLERMFSARQLNLLNDRRLRTREAVEFARNVDCDGRLPGIGDTGGGDSRIKVLNPFVPCRHEEFAHLHTGDRAYLARHLALSGGDVDRIRDRYADWMLLFHGEAGRDLTGATGGVALTPQAGGTVAGPDVAFGDAPGWGYIKDVSRAACEGTWSATWRIGNEDRTGIRLTMLGDRGREIITGRGEGYGFFGKSPLDAYVLARSPAKGETTVYVAVLEPFQGHPFIRSVEPLTVSGGVGAKVCVDGRTDYLFRKTEEVLACASEIDGRRVEFDAAFARITLHDSGKRELHLIQGSYLKFGEEVLQGPAIPRGRVEAVHLTDDSLTVSLSSGEGLAEGDLIVFRNPACICNSSAGVKTVERLDANRLKVGLSLSLNLSEGVVQSVEGDAFTSDTCMTKLKVCPGLFDGKAVYVNGVRRGVLKTATEGRFAFADPSAGAGLKAGDRFLVCDLDVGDEVEGMRSADLTLPQVCG
ncbi:MAG: hypothetical protein A3F84_12710 [Candidatus Handelsmanbacteria bacterium RIFCSPLOWO2_12_FULL_64_10]|uniref:Uncharacterized protein n=1 Tax=Handelsmanbacteria sp. (strain RIFCSPLOWO2_12_FULL_64_10) TaxID=1817868 RepID=A0A1F6CWL1_HANXR|nr:MAG: hypothetical protein A3F84_12710 [Candidatus Handelsmanbacteria bacterium RIFCSPLOWO2_12_FULL_64_10]